jgi:DNA-binding CsgD family transcriptional regulator/PAS domain-containing protein
MKSRYRFQRIHSRFVEGEDADARVGQRIMDPAMVTVEDFSRLVSGIYAAAVTPQRWESAVADIQRALDGNTSALLIPEGPAARRYLATTLNIDARDSYAEYYCHLDYAIAAVDAGPVGAVRTWTELVEPKKNSEFYADWLRPRHFKDALLVRLSGEPIPCTFIVGAPKRSESFDTPERVKLMSGLVPHLQQALRTQEKLAALSQRSGDLAGALDAVGHGIIVVGSGCLVIHLNTAAERILRADDGLHIRSGQITATSTFTDRKLQRALCVALVDDSSNIRSGRSLICERPSGKRPYIIHVLPLHRAATPETSSGATALVLIIDPEQEPEPAVALLRRLHGLTNTEAQVALRIVRGADLKQVSEELSVSVTTVRTHLQHLFAKTDTHRQAELIRHLLAISP